MRSDAFLVPALFSISATGLDDAEPSTSALLSCKQLFTAIANVVLMRSCRIIGVIIQITAVPGMTGNAGATAQFIVGRAITGVGNGINTSTVPTYQAEYVVFESYL